ncbi:MAG: hypothetical protein OXJ38_08375 [Gammaproteobacteria bacterium]|nr:hypothetical protein [Gammaproteobacteria bacterium]
MAEQDVIDISTKRPLAANGNGGNGNLTEYRLGQLEKKVETLESKVDGISHQLIRIETKMGNAAWVVGCVGIPILVALLSIAVSSLF